MRIANTVGSVQSWRIGLSIMLALLASLAFAAESISTSSVRFQRYTIDDGLSQTTVRAIAQDPSGFLWFGTQDGLNRFDGYEFRNFYRDSTPMYALSDNHIQVLVSDSVRSTLWIGTLAGGLNRLDLKSEKFHSYVPGDASGIKNAKINDIELRGEALWLSTDFGLERFDIESQKVTQHIALEGANEFSINEEGMVATAHRQGVAILSGSALEPLPNWSYGAAHTLLFDRSGHLWVGLSNGGLLHYSERFELLQHFKAEVGLDTLPSNEIRALMLSSRDEIWIGTVAGVAIFDRVKQRFVRFAHDPSNFASIPANRSHAIFEDRDAQVWVGTWSKGVAVHNPKTRAIEHARQTAMSRDLPANPVRTVALEPDGTFWLGVLEGGGLVHYDFERGVLEKYVNDPKDPNSISNNGIQSIVRTREGELWIATSGNGINHMISPGRFVHYKVDAPAPYTLAGNNIVTLMEDYDGALWAGADAVGLLYRCKGCRSFEPFVSADGRSTPPSINAIFRSSTGVLWVGTQGGGLLAINSETREMQIYKADTSGLSHNSVTHIHERGPQELWLGTQGGGVNVLKLSGDPLEGAVNLSFHAIRKADGLGADAVGSVQQGIDGNIWVATTVGISSVDPSTYSVTNLTESAGLGRSGYYIGATARDNSGRLMFGGLEGLIRFNPLELAKLGKPRAPVITGFKISNIAQRMQWQDKNSPLQVATPFLSELTLLHNQSMWSADFSALVFGRDHVSFQYRLLGLSDEWIDGVSKQHSATFTNLPAGIYTFEVRARRDARDFGPVSRVQMKVLSSPWLSPIAKLAYLCSALLLITYLLASARSRLQERAETLQKVEESEEQLRNALWGSRDELWDLDLENGVLQSQNPIPDLMRGRFSNQDGKSLSAQDVALIAHPDDRAAMVRALDKHLSNQTEFYEAAFRMRTVAHTWLWVLSRGRVIKRDSSGRALRMVGSLRDISQLKAVEEKLRSLNDELESRVTQRTEDLSTSNADLSKALNDLKAAQRQLVDSEKMASLGNLVAGVAHEINTPLGIGVTAASHLRQETERISLNLKQGKLTKSDIEQFSATAVEASDLVLKNLDRASKLVRSFKQVAVDQGSEERRSIGLAVYLEEVLFALKPTLRRSPHIVKLEISKDIQMDTFPGALWQIVFNLVGNSLAHAFPDPKDVGTLSITARAVGEQVELVYADNGAGMSEEVRKRVFEPFFTTKRGQGGSGLGLHIVYNLVTQLLRGQIRCESAPGQGVKFIIHLPRRS